MGTAAKHRLYDFREFCDLIPEWQKADLIDGVIYIASPENIGHHGIYGWLYWIIDPLEKKMTCFELIRKGKFKKVPIKADRIASKVIPGFWVRPSWFWQSPLPSKRKALAEILASVSKEEHE